MYSSPLTRALSAFERSSKLHVKTTLKESTRASGGGGNSIVGTSAVGCARKMLFAVNPVSCTAGSSRRPKRTCFQQHLPKAASALVAVDAFLTFTRSLLPRVSEMHSLDRGHNLRFPCPLRKFGHYRQLCLNPVPLKQDRQDALEHAQIQKLA